MYIKLEKLSKSFKSVKAVDKLELIINDGELVSLLGPSGCGKSTTLAMIAGLEKPTSGNIYFDDKNVNDIEAEKRGIGMVFQSYALYPHMTVLENIIFPLRMQKISKKIAKEKAKSVAKMLHLDEYLSRKPGELSGGQQQRVAIARAVIKEPKILLLDEPLSNLDARLRIELREEIRKLQRKLKITTIFVTHDQEEAMSISDKIILMNEGVCQQFSSPKDMYMNPVNKFVAGFLGNPPMNFLDAYFDDKSEKLLVDYGNSQKYMSKSVHIDIEKLSDIKNLNSLDRNDSNTRSYGKSEFFVIGVRPEDLRINNENYDFIGEIISVQTLGKEVYVKIDAFENEILAVLPWDSNYEIGDDIKIEIKKIHVFEK